MISDGSCTLKTGVMAAENSALQSVINCILKCIQIV